MSSTSIRRFTVVLRGPAGVYWPPGKSFTVTKFPSGSGPVEILLQTRRAVTPNFSKPTPRGLHVQVTGDSASLENALEHFSAAAELLTPIVCLVANAPIGILEAAIAWDSSPNTTDRDFFQQFLVDDRVMPLDPHSVPNPQLKEVLEVLPKHQKTDRLHRALSYYHQALIHWRPGAELNALAWMYMGVEALTPIALQAYLDRERIDKPELLRRWGIDLTQLDPEVRRRLIFLDDTPTYRSAKAASDGLEHGFLTFDEIRTHAEAAFLPTARYLRGAILHQIGLSTQTVDALLNAPYDSPFYLYYTKFIRATLTCPSDDLAADDQLYPIMQWKSTRKEAPSEPAADPRITYEESLHLRAAPGVKVKSGRLFVAGPTGPAVVPIPADGA